MAWKGLYFQKYHSASLMKDKSILSVCMRTTNGHLPFVYMPSDDGYKCTTIWSAKSAAIVRVPERSGLRGGIHTDPTQSENLQKQ